jgi:hypothetical protein
MSDYSDCRTILERALASANGLRVSFDTWSEACRFRLRCNKARVEDRKASKAMFKPGEPKWNKSQFDCLVLRLGKGETTISIEREKAVEFLSVEEF